MNHSNCVISAVGRSSLHRMWLKGECNFDLHLVVYDDSMEEFRGDTEYICHIKGYKLRVVYRYLEMYPELKERYNSSFRMMTSKWMPRSSIPCSRPCGVTACRLHSRHCVCLITRGAIRCKTGIASCGISISWK